MRMIKSLTFVLLICNPSLIFRSPLSLREKISTVVTLYSFGTRSCWKTFGPQRHYKSIFVLGVLFHRAILMSGSALSPWALVHQPARYAAQVAHYVGCAPTLPSPHLLNCLREKPLEVLLATPILGAPEFAFAFGPSVDGVVIDTGEPPGKYSKSQKVPFIKWLCL